MPAKRFKQPSQLRQPVRPNQYFDSLDSFHQHCLSSTSTNQRRITPRDSTRAQPTQLKDHQPTSLIVTHDFKGGYSENPYERGYSFEWLGPTDKFIYFSHHRVTVPPTQWINACHNHGTKVLGTLIFEWDKIDEIDLLLRGPSDPPRSTNYYLPLSQSDQKYTPLISTYFADRLIDLALELDLHGWLINVEVDLPKYDPIRSGSISRSLKIWLEYLRLRGELRLGPHWEVCWYDSLSHVDGRNQWLSRLDRVHNLPFFTSSSSIFLDYHWTSEHLTRSKQLLRRLSEIDQTSRSPRQRLLKLSSDYLETLSSNESLMKSLDQSVHVGVDVYGRGCPCGGGFSSWKAIEEIVQAGLSVALFAPGWTWESHHLHQAREKDVVEGAKKEEAPELLWWKAWWRDELYQWAGLFSSSVEGHVTRQESPNAYVDACRIAEDLERPRPIRGTSTSELDQQRPILEFFPARWSAPRRYFYTNWSMGSGSNGYWVESRQFSDSSKRISSWTDMSVSFPINDLSIGGCKMFCIEDDGSVVQEGLVSCQLIDRVGWSGSGSLMIDMSQETNQNESNNSLKDRYIWLNTTLVDPGPNEAIKIRLVWKPISEQGSLPLGVVLQTTRDP
ncbi:glycosyl hydrolase family 85-domain-containing protein, partial [Phakopsora pachyrhizi]